MDHQLSQRGVEGTVRPGERLDRPAPDIGPGDTSRAGLDERRGIDCCYVLGAEPAGKLLGEDPLAAADVERGESGLDPGEVGEHGRQLLRVAAHEAVVGITRDVEAHPVY